ncbi:Ribose operon repressor [bioreactor metagenome]|uniref:Ribose operon repressor n=1 Tax=bioreactor metagenome TaxID=1076179 RepID=A0A644YF45_9ZZZZ
MSTIKDVAKLAEVSPSTVSIVLNSAESDRRISPSTRKRVLKAVQKLDYRPSITARRLRMEEPSIPTIALFWPLDSRGSVAGELLACIHRAFTCSYFDCELITCSFENDRLKDLAALKNSRFDGAIIGSTSEADMMYLKESPPRAPVVLYNRELENYHSVVGDNVMAGKMAAELLHRRDHKRVGVYTFTSPPPATKLRCTSFMRRCDELGIQAEIICRETSFAQFDEVIAATEQMIKSGNVPKAIVLANDSTSFSVVSCLMRAGYRIPEDVEILCTVPATGKIGRNLRPSITQIVFPLEDMLTDCVNILIHAISHHITVPINKIYAPQIVYGDSMPEPDGIVQKNGG